LTSTSRRDLLRARRFYFAEHKFSWNREIDKRGGIKCRKEAYEGIAVRISGWNPCTRQNKGNPPMLRKREHR
jgi:hypothetical protein